MVRLATKEDHLDLLLLAKQFLKEYNTNYSIDLSALSESVLTMVDDPNFLVLVLDKDGSVEGLLCATIGSPFFSKDKVSSELAWFLNKDVRGKKESTLLIDAYEKWAKSKECKFITMSDIDILTDLRPLYESRGYTLTEKTHVKEI